MNNSGAGTIEVGSLTLEGDSKLDLTGGDDGNNGLTFTAGSGKLDIKDKAWIDATGKTLDFTGVEVTNKNSTTQGVLTADMLTFGSGGSLSGVGKYDSAAEFQSGSRLKLDSSGHVDFRNNAVTFESGAVIEIKINENVGALVTTGTITVNENVKLEIVGGSQFSGGSTREFVLLQGELNSTFHELDFVDNLFFTLSETIFDQEKYPGQLIIQVVKTNNWTDYAASSNQRNLSKQIDLMIKEGRVSGYQADIFDATMRLSSDTVFRETLDDLSGASRENAVLYSLSSPWQRAFNNIDNSLSLALPTQGTGADASTFLGQTSRRPWSLSNGLWADLYHSYLNLNADVNASGGSVSGGASKISMMRPSDTPALLASDSTRPRPRTGQMIMAL